MAGVPIEEAIVVDVRLFELLLCMLVLRTRDTMPNGGRLTIESFDARSSPDRDFIDQVIIRISKEAIRFPLLPCT